MAGKKRRGRKPKNTNKPEDEQVHAKVAKIDEEKAGQSTARASDPITPPPPVAPEVLQHAVKTYLRSHGHSAGEEDDSESETELLMQERRRTFENGMQGSVDKESEDDAAGQGVGEDEDELSTGGEEEEANSDVDELKTDPPKLDPPAPTKKPEPLVQKKKKNSPLSLKFSVPVNGANMAFTVLSTISYAELLSHLADTMSIAPKNVRVGYRFSLQARSNPFNHLGDANHWLELVVAARRLQETSKSKKEFVVELKDLVLPAAKAGKGAKKAEKKRKRGDSDSEEDSVTGTGDEIDGKKVRSKKMSGPQWVAKLEQDNACVEHGGHGCLKYVTGHVLLTNQDLSTWAIFLQNGYVSTTTPPLKLKVGDHKMTRTTPAPPPPPAAPAPAVPPPYHTPAPQPRTRYEDVASSPGDEVEDVTLFPRISNWLQELDSGARGHDGHEFTQFAADFEREKYIRIVDLVDMRGTAAKLFVTLGYFLTKVRECRRDRTGL
ncbi:hypothetical protein C8R44DRAFT_739505 [Mycena epipterygia]|nr:hypothetical protein C8R44DRAFT_739505 [Mycena epipterygia]